MAEDLAGAVAPAVTNAPDAQSVTAPTAPAGQEVPQEPVTPRTYTEEEHKERVAKAVSERIAKERRRLERELRPQIENEYLRKQLESGSQPVQKPQSDAKPQQKDFADWESYNEALTDWKVEQRLAKEREQSQGQRQEQEAQQAERQLARSIQDNFKAAAEKYPDFHEVVTQDGLPFYKGSPILAYIAKSKAGGDVAYALGKDPDEAQRINELHPIDQVLALRDLEAKLTAAPQASKAPSPIVPNGTQSSSRKDWKDMDTEQHVKTWLNRKRK